uniref:Remorin C-terminal domain-containing protein n=1 Tax=Noccaea caerulescens TaxID=107243 RepID=A0A1J3GN21_NOCCA
MRKTSVSSNSFGGFLSPGAPSYSDNKGWSSERVPHPSSTTSSAAAINGGRRHIGSASALTTPFYSGRAIPSKWEDAERWICSPVATYPPGVCQNPSVSYQFSEQRRQKSKSGPIVPPTLPHPPTSSSSAIGCYHYSPRMTMRAMEANQGNMKGLMVVGSPFSTGVLEADRVFRGGLGGGGGCDGYRRGHGHSRSWVDLMSEETSSLGSKTDTEEKAEDTKEEEMTTAMQSPVVLRRDIATQMSPQEMSPDNNHQSSQEPKSSSPPLVVSVIDEPPMKENPCRGEVREVKMDKGARMIKRPKRRVMSSSRVIRREQPEVEDNSEASASSSSWDISEPAMTLSKLQREEAKIAAWENLQKAKAEAAIRKLEVKLEKKKSASMDKILNKLQTAKLKAQEMRRSSVSIEQEQQQQQENHQISKHSVKITHLVRRHTFMTPFMSCFAPRVDCRKSSSAL